MSSHTKALSALAAIILLFLLFHFAIHRPMSREYIRLQERNRELSRLIAQAKLEELGLPQVRDEIETARRQLKLVEIRYPSSIDPFYGHISEAARSRGVNIISTREEAFPRDDLPGVERRLIRLEGRGSYQSVGEFLEALERLPIRVSVSGLGLQRNGQADPDVSLKLSLEVYLKKGA